MYVDAIDANIIRLLQSNGRATLDELSQATGRSSSQCQRRQKRLENVGIIKRYVALVAPDAVGYPVQVFTLVSVERDEADTFDRFEESIRADDHPCGHRYWDRRRPALGRGPGSLRLSRAAPPAHRRVPDSQERDDVCDVGRDQARLRGAGRAARRRGGCFARSMAPAALPAASDEVGFRSTPSMISTAVPSSLLAKG